MKLRTQMDNRNLLQTPAKADPIILYIDDDPQNRALINRLLTNYHFRVIEAATGLEGIQIARKLTPDLILMDINMPGLDGHETTTRMRSIGGLKHTPIIALTVRSTKGERELALAAGCDGYITKPIDVDSFPHQIIAYLQGHKDTISKDEQHLYLGKYSQKLVERLENKIVELQEANARLQKIDKIKSDFVTLAAHELRTPITLVYGYARLMQAELETSGDSRLFEKGNIGDLANRVYRSVQRLSDVVNDILNISLIEADEMRLERRPVSLQNIINATLEELTPAKTGRQLNIVTENIESLPTIIGDNERLRQVFWNLLSNAVKFTPDNGSIVIRGWVAYPSDLSPNDQFAGSPPNDPTQGDVVIMIKDTGIGIDPSEQKQIFERFYIVGNTAYHSTSKTAFGGGGMGLGLPIAQGIIAAHAGRIWVESPGRNEATNPGSTFYVLLPIDSSKR